MAKLLVTGRAGFIGSYVVGLFSGKRFEVIVNDLSTESAFKMNPQAKLYQRYTHKETVNYLKEEERVA